MMRWRKLTGRLIRGKKNVPLRFVVVLPFVAQIVAAVGLTGYLSWRNGSQAVNELTGQLSKEVTHHIEKHLQNFTETSFLFLHLNEAAVRAGTLDVNDFEQWQRLFWQQTQFSDTVKTLYLSTADGRFLQIEQGDPPKLSIRDASTAPNWLVYQLDEEGNPTNTLESEPFDPRTRAWFQEAQKTGQPVVSPIYRFADPPVLGITSAIPLYNDQNDFLGVMAVDVTLQQMNTFLQDLRISKSGQVFILEQTGKVVASSEWNLDDREALENRQRVEALNSPNRVVRETARYIHQNLGSFETFRNPRQFGININGKRQFVRATRFHDDRGIDWLTVVVIPERDLTKQIRQNTYTTIILCLVALGGAAVLGLYTSNWITRPIWRLAKTSEKIAKGELERPVPGSRIKEFGLLARSLNQMIQRLQSSQAQLAHYSRSLEDEVEQRTQALSQEIRDRQAAEAALRRSEEKFAKAFHGSPDPIAITTFENGQILEVNDSFLKSVGYSLDETLHHTAAELNLLATPEELARVVEQLREKRALRNLETKFRTKSGDVRTVLLSAEIINLGGRDCVLYIANDISDRVAVQDALQKAESRYRSIFENAAEGIFQATPDGRYLSVNPALVRMYGYESPEALMANLTHIDPKLYLDLGDREIFINLMEQKGAASNLEYRIYRRDGTVMWVSENSRAVKDEEGNLLYYEGTIEDITRRKEIESELQQQRRYLRLVLDNIPQQVFWKDVDSVFLGCNKNWADAAHLASPEAVIGLTDYDLLPREVAEEFREVDRQIVINNRAEYNSIQTKQRPDANGNPVWLSVSKIPIHDEEGTVIGILGVIEDITLRKIAEEKRQEAEEALRQEQEKSEALLLNILPEPIAEQLKQNKNPIAEQFSEVTILFADIVGFTPLSARLPATELVDFLNQIFSQFDHLAKHHGLEKIKTIGDAYMIAGGLPVRQPEHAEAIAEMALDMQASITKLSAKLGEPLQIRIGINTGPVVAGVIGVAKFIYDLWGDTVNVASRMESYGVAGKIQVTAATYERLKERYIFEERGEIDVKGKGNMMTYWLTGRKTCSIGLPEV